MNKKIKYIFIYLPSVCNLKCSYCFRKDTEFFPKLSDNYMGNLESILDRFELDSRVKVEYGMSEPTLYIDKIKEIKKVFDKYSRTHNTDFFYMCKSNGVDLNGVSTLMKRMLISKYGMSISLDGVNSDRVNFNKPLREWFERIEDLIPNISAHVSISNGTIMNQSKSLLETLLEIQELGFKEIKYYFLYHSKDYLNEDFQNRFYKSIKEVFNKCNDQELKLSNFDEIENLYKEYNDEDVIRQKECVTDLTIFQDGTFTTGCGFKYSGRLADSIYSNFDLWQPYNETEENERDIMKEFCLSKHCKNYQCSGCGIYPLLKYGEITDCKLRSLERQAFEEVINDV